MRTPTSLMETANFKPEVAPTDAGRVSTLYLMSEEFRRLAWVALREAGMFQQAKYNAGIFCLGHALELTYKMLLVKDGLRYRRSHDFGGLFTRMEPGTQCDVESIARKAGWPTCDEFHGFLANELDFVDRKYHEDSSGWDHWTRDETGQNIGHKLWPQVFDLCDALHRYAASTVWKDPSLPVHPMQRDPEIEDRPQSR